MTIPTGPISLDNIQTEFGGAAPIGIDEYYQGAGTGYVTSSNYTPAGVIPASGAISIGNFSGVTKNVAFIFNETVTADLTTGYLLKARAQLAGWNGAVPLIATVTINAGVTVTGPIGGSGAFNTLNFPGPYPAGSTLTIINNGTIAGAGGSGGAGGSVSGASFSNGANGTGGGVGLYIDAITTAVYNYGTIGGGGGGGGGGGASRNTLDSKTWYGASGGGGGGGRALGAFGAAGTSSGNDTNGVASNGGAGTLGAAGAGGARFVIGSVIGSGFGGAGGNLGLPGSPGTTPDLGYVNGGYSNPGAGGAAGGAVVGGVYITWYSFGTRLGTIDNPGINAVPGGVVSGNSYEVSHSVLWPTTTCNSSFYFNADGTTSYTGSGFPDFYNNPNWYTPTTAGIGSSYYVRFTQTSSNGGTLGGNTTVGVWTTLSSSRYLTLSRTSTGFSTRTFTVQFATDAGGTNIVASGTLTLSANVDI